VIGFAIRAGYLHLDSALLRSFWKFAAAGIVLGTALWLTVKLSATYLAALSAFRDETTFLLLIAVGSLVYAGSIVLLFGRGWLRSLVR
jgi:putative peptidoglycan lipid II flippase